MKRSFALAMVINEDHEKAFLFYSDIFMFFLSFENYINKAINKILSFKIIYEFWQCLKIRVNVTPQNAASHRGLLCLLREFSSKNLIRFKNHS